MKDTITFYTSIEKVISISIILNISLVLDSCPDGNWLGSIPSSISQARSLVFNFKNKKYIILYFCQYIIGKAYILLLARP